MICILPIVYCLRDLGAELARRRSLILAEDRPKRGVVDVERYGDNLDSGIATLLQQRASEACSFRGPLPF
jgi:hypothetical protein